MPRAKRAKIFAPFDALSGLHVALRNKEKKTVPAHSMTDLDYEILERRLHEITLGSVINVVYYHSEQSNNHRKALQHTTAGEYIMITGMVSAINLDKRYLKVVDTVIPIDNIKSISST